MLVTCNDICCSIHRNWCKSTSTSMRRPLLTAIIATFWKDYALLASFFFLNDIILRLGQRLLLANFLMYFRKSSDVTYYEAFTYAVGVALLMVLSTLFSNQITFLSLHYGMKIRVAVCSLIYRKVMLLIILFKKYFNEKMSILMKGTSAFAYGTRQSGQFVIK